MSVDVLARVAILGQERVFQRQTGDDGKVADATIIDGTGSLRLSMWDEKAEILKQLKTGDIILLRGAYTREGFNGSIALNIGKMGTVTINPEMAEAEELPEYSAVTKIAELRDGFPASVQAEVVEAPSEKKIRTKDGRDLTVVSLRLRDNTGEIGISLWNENAEKAKNYAPGTKLRISDAFTRIGYDGDLELSTRTFTKIETISDKTLLDSSENESASRFSEGEHFEGDAILLEASRSTVENTCPNCGGNVRERDGSFICNECGRIPRANQRLILEAVLESNGREFTAVFSGNDAETLLGADYDYSTNLISQGLDENTLVESAKKQLKGRRLKIEGTVVESSATRLRIDVSRVEQFLN
jgi:replication factor A1